METSYNAMHHAMEANNEKIRLDKWLWAARFFKTRSMASQAVNGGKVHVNGQRTKPARIVQIGDELRITRNESTFIVKVLALSGYRRPAVEARLLYEESPESIKTREEESEMRKLTRTGYAAPAGRPGKRDRRKIREFTKKDE
jgi:ribosome-associated heat shock protein Hsp15